MSSALEKKAAPPLRDTTGTKARAAAPSLRLVTPPPELYPNLIAAIRVLWRNRHAGVSSTETAERGRETGARL